MAFKGITQLLVLTLLVAVVLAKRPRKGLYLAGKNKGCASNDVANNLTALWTKVNAVTNPIQVHVHDNDRSKCDSYFGCSYGKRNHSHSHGSHAGHKHGSHKHGSHKHGSHKHGSHKHDSHDSHRYHGAQANDNHIHIHMSINKNDDCGVVTYKPKDQYVYARCDMVPANRKILPVVGSILMRQKPHQPLETIIKLRGFKGASEGAKDGKHAFFFDVHEFADFSNKCDSFGGHDHVHEHGEGDGHDHSGHDHGQGEGHDHGGHDHDHAHHIHEGDWGNLIINKKGVSKMEVNCTQHELFGPESMLGRGIVLHDKDDKTVSCCSITYANIADDAWGK